MKNNTESTTNLNFATANDFANMLNANYRTVLKILVAMSENKEVETKRITKNNREVDAYSYNNDTIKRIQQRLKEIKKGSRTIVQKLNTTQSTNVLNSDIKRNTTAFDTTSQNVTIYEVTKKNNELENQIQALEFEKKDLEMKNVKTESELLKLQSEYKLIEMKQQTFESENSRLSQSISALEGKLAQKNRLILILASVLGIVFTVAITASVCVSLLK